MRKLYFRLISLITCTHRLKFRKKFGLIILVTILLILSAIQTRPLAYFNKPISVATIHCINLEKDKERWEFMKNQSVELSLPFQRWPAIHGGEIKFEQLYPYGIGHAMVRPDRFDESYSHLQNLGIVATFITVRNLLHHLSTLPFNPEFAHLILEDDVVIPENILKKNSIFSKRSKFVPSDWDLLYLGIWRPVGTEIAPGVLKLSRARRSNTGNFAYLVKHGSLDKILGWLKYMIDAIDEQYVLKFDEWNAYAFQPNYFIMNVKLNDNSSINGINFVK